MLVLALHVHEVSGAVIALVGVVAGVLAIVGARSFARSGSRNLLFVSAAFGVFALKGIFTSYAIYSRVLGHEHLELVGSLADLVTILLLAAPLVVRADRG